MPRRVSSPTFVGRAEELEALAAALARAEAGEATAVFISGESGVGKSRLAAEFERSAREAGARVLAGACVDLANAELPYAPLVAALRALARETPREELEELAGADRDELARLLPELAGTAVTPPPADPLAQVRLFEALLGLLVRLGRQAPVVLVVEDLHWADPSTRGFLQFLVRNARRAPLTLVATYRSDDLHRRHPLRPFLADIERAPGVERLPIAAFTRDELAVQLEAILDEPPDSRLVKELFDRSDGNAFFAEELLAASREGVPAVPETIRDALALRVERLSEPAQRALRVAAVAGSGVSHRLLAATAELPEAELGQAVREAIEHHVLVHDPSTEAYAFRHALLREAIYDDLLPNERAGLHRGLARALEDDERLGRQGAAAERAFHWSGAHEPAPALRASIEAGGDAEAVSAYTEANRQFERAIELWDAVSDEDRPAGITLVDLLQRAAEAAFLAGGNDRAVSLARRALVSIDADRDTLSAAVLHARLGWYLWTQGGANDEALAEYRAATALVPPEPTPARARILAGEAHLLMLEGDCARASELAREAIAIARSVGSTDIECNALNTLGAAIGILGDREQAIETLRRAQSLAPTQMGAQLEEVRACVNLGEILDEDGRVNEAADVAVEGWRRLRSRIASQAWFVLGDAMLRLVRVGRWDEAERLFDEAGEDPPLNFFGFATLVGVVDLETSRGDLEAAETHLERARRVQAGGPAGTWRQAEARAVGQVALGRGRPEVASAAIADLLDAPMPSRSAVMVAFAAYVVGLRAEADLAARARALGDEPAAGDAVRRGARLLDRIHAIGAPEQWPLGTPPVEVFLHTELGELELARAQGTAEADGWAAHAERWEELGCPLAGAYARWREGETAVAAGLPRERASAPLQAARTVAAQLGAQPLLHEVDELARRARIGLDGPAPAAETISERLGLTARELDVLRLLADGRTNAQIGATLYMSPKTASVHVSRIIAKLDVRTRIEAATAAHRLGLAPPSQQAE